MEIKFSEARFYVEDNNGIVYYLGYIRNYSRGIIRELMEGENGEFVDGLFEQFYTFLYYNPFIDFRETKETKRRVFFNTLYIMPSNDTIRYNQAAEKIVVISIWVGNSDPCFEIIDHQFVPYERNNFEHPLTNELVNFNGEHPLINELNNFTGDQQYALANGLVNFDHSLAHGLNSCHGDRYYVLSNGSQLFADEKYSFLILLNRYVKDASTREKILLDRNTLLRFWILQSDCYFFPLVYCYMIKVDDLMPDHLVSHLEPDQQEELKSCPNDMLPCEIITPDNRSYYYFINKKIWINGEEFDFDNVKMLGEVGRG